MPSRCRRKSGDGAGTHVSSRFRVKFWFPVAIYALIKAVQIFTEQADDEQLAPLIGAVVASQQSRTWRTDVPETKTAGCCW